jgi:hypothetical protein
MITLIIVRRIIQVEARLNLKELKDMAGGT